MSGSELANSTDEVNSEQGSQNLEHEVILHVYDMHWSTCVTKFIGLGAFHCGVELMGEEYSFAGHSYEFTGIYRKPPKFIDYDSCLTYREPILIGTTTWSKNDIVKTLVSWGDKHWRGFEYHLFENNCNHFCNTLCHTICGKKIPPWLNRLSSIVVAYMPFVDSLLPATWIRPANFHPPQLIDAASTGSNAGTNESDDLATVVVSAVGVEEGSTGHSISSRIFVTHSCIEIGGSSTQMMESSVERTELYSSIELEKDDGEMLAGTGVDESGIEETRSQSLESDSIGFEENINTAVIDSESPRSLSFVWLKFFKL